MPRLRKEIEGLRDSKRIARFEEEAKGARVLPKPDSALCIPRQRNRY
jgi:hypothetical protein